MTRRPNLPALLSRRELLLRAGGGFGSLALAALVGKRGRGPTRSGRPPTSTAGCITGPK